MSHDAPKPGLRLSRTAQGLCLAAALVIFQGASLFAMNEVFIKDRKIYEKSIRTRMPTQILINQIQQDLKQHSEGWQTQWQTFVVEDDEKKDEYVIVARATDKKWAFSALKDDCPKPDNFDSLKNAVDNGGTPVTLNVLIGVKRSRSFFRYVVSVYEPMYPFWQNPCYQWSLPPGMANDAFYKDNYSMQAYSQNIRKKVYDLVTKYADWKPPKDVKKLPVMKGPGQEYYGGAAEELSDEERKLSLAEQQKILEQRRKAKRGQ